MSGVELGTKTTIVRNNNELLLISPGPLSKAHLSELEELGQVTALVAPNKMHHLYLQDAQSKFPEAKTYLAPGLAEKRPDLTFDETLPSQELGEWGLEQQLVLGMPELNETVFWHEASKTLILTDLAFNFPSHQHWLTRLVLKFNGVYGKFGPSRLLKFYFVKDRKAMGRDLATVFEWPAEQIVVAHGENVLQAKSRQLEKAYGWLSPTPA